MADLTTSSAVDTFMQAADEAAMQTALALVPGTDVQAYDAKLTLVGSTVFPFLIPIAKNVSVLTTGAPADVANVTLPSWCTRFIIALTNGRLVAETASGTLAGAAFTVRDAANGTGNVLTTSASGPSSTSVTVGVAGAATSGVTSTATTLYLNQSANSANAGTISMYLLIVPLL